VIDDCKTIYNREVVPDERLDDVGLVADDSFGAQTHDGVRTNPRGTASVASILAWSFRTV